MTRLPGLAPLGLCLLGLCLVPAARAAELPSFLQSGDAFCTRQSDYDDFVAHGTVRANSAIETCVTVDRPTRVAVLGGQSKVKTMVRVMSGPMAYTVGWTNGALPLAN